VKRSSDRLGLPHILLPLSSRVQVLEWRGGAQLRLNVEKVKRAIECNRKGNLRGAKVKGIKGFQRRQLPAQNRNPSHCRLDQYNIATFGD
jgi:hypothetical protein